MIVEPPAPERIFYDGSCGLCHRGVRFVVARDPGRVEMVDIELTELRSMALSLQ